MSQVPPFSAASTTRSMLKTGDAVAEEPPFILSSPKFDGMGMGLAICSPIIDAQEGRLWVSPNSPQHPVFQFILRCETATSADLLHECNADHSESCRFTVVLRRVPRPDFFLRFAGNRVPRRMTKNSPEQASVVLIVDDDPSVRTALARLFKSVGLQTAAFASAPEMLQSTLPDAPSCLVLDVRLPGQSGLDFQAELVKRNFPIPIIFMTGHGDIPMSVRAMKAGAIDFLPKPFRDQDMLDAVAKAVQHDRKRRDDEKAVAGPRAQYALLTPREREILALVVAGLMNKQVAAEIGIAEITVKIHRGHIMKKMGAKSLADLVRMAEVLGIRRMNHSR
jgi:FixJ family two-component response regulator